MISKLCLPILAFFIAVQSSPVRPSTYDAIRTNALDALRGVALNAPDDRGRTPLMMAAEVGTPEAMKTLLLAGADPNAADSFGVTALMLGARDIARVRLLLDAGARANDKSKQDQTALHIAASTTGSIETIRLLVSSGADPKAIGAGGRNGLLVAATANDLDMVRYFLDQGINVNSVNRTDISGHTALMGASAQNNTAMVRLLLQKGADPNLAATDAGAVKNGPLAFKGRTALMMAVPYGSPEMIRLLLDAHANVNAADVAGMTPLMFAVASENQDPEVVQLLLSSGANLNAKSTTGETALDWARKYGSPAILNLLHDTAAKKTPSAVKREPAPLPSREDLRSMIQMSTALLQRSGAQAETAGGCVNCHHQYFTEQAIAATRGKAIPIDEPIAVEQRQAMLVSLRGRANTFAQRQDSGGGLDSVLNTLLALQADKYTPDAITDSAVAYILSRQYSDGRWPREEASRAPLQDGDINRAAVAVSMLQAFAPPSLRADADAHVARTRQWLMSVRAKTTDDQAMLLVGLKKSGAPVANVQTAGKALLVLQGADGGWGGNRNLESDAYATSEALIALVDSGIVPVTDANYQRGIRFLVEKREKDGSWYVRSRAPKFQPYFESGFPDAHDQWISAAASAKAIVALARSIP